MDNKIQRLYGFIAGMLFVTILQSCLLHLVLFDSISTVTMFASLVTIVFFILYAVGYAKRWLHCGLVILAVVEIYAAMGDRFLPVRTQRGVESGHPIVVTELVATSLAFTILFVCGLYLLFRKNQPNKALVTTATNPPPSATPPAPLSHL